MTRNIYNYFSGKYILNLALKGSVDHKITLIIILGLGIFLRLYSLFIGEAFHVFSINDDISAFQVAFELARLEGTSWYLSPSAFSGGGAAGPLWALFILIIYKLGFDSISGALFIMALLSSLSVYLLYKIALLYFSPQYSLLAALLFSTSPWAVYYSVGMYNPMPTVLLGSLLFLALWKTLSIHYSKYIVYVCMLIAMLPQFHMITIFFFPSILLLLMFSKKKINLHYLALGAIIGILFYLPYIIGDGINNWENTKSVISGTEQQFSYSTYKVFSAPVTMLSNAPTDWIGRETDGFSGYKDFGSKYFYHYSILLVINLINLFILLLMFIKFIASSIKLFWSNKFSLNTVLKKNRTLAFISTLIILPLLLFVLTGKNYSTRYTLIMLSLLFIMQIYVLLDLKNRKLAKALTIYFLVNIFFSIYILISHYNYKNTLIYTSKTFFPSFKKLESIKQNINNSIPDNTYIKIRFSNSIKNLPESQKKLYYALDQFIDLSNKNNSPTNTKKIFIVKGGENYDTFKYPNIIYTSPSIILLKE